MRLATSLAPSAVMGKLLRLQDTEVSEAIGRGRRHRSKLFGMQRAVWINPRSSMTVAPSRGRLRKGRCTSGEERLEDLLERSGSLRSYIM